MSKVVSIREYQLKDYEDLREICFRTATGHYRDNKELVAALYCEHYLEYEGEHCFVVADHNDRAVGYVICAPNYKKFAREFKANKFAKVRAISRKEIFLKRLEFFAMKTFLGNYPAHLHINILDGYQRLGLGHKLINRLLLHLDTMGVSKLHLGCSASNDKGVGFYKKFGFHIINKISGTILFGIDIREYVESINKD